MRTCIFPLTHTLQHWKLLLGWLEDFYSFFFFVFFFLYFKGGQISEIIAQHKMYRFLRLNENFLLFCNFIFSFDDGALAESWPSDLKFFFFVSFSRRNALKKTAQYLKKKILNEYSSSVPPPPPCLFFCLYFCFEKEKSILFFVLRVYRSWVSLYSISFCCYFYILITQLIFNSNFFSFFFFLIFFIPN